MDERTYLGKAFDFGQQRFRFAARKPHQGGIHKDVFNPGKLTIESGPEFKQTSDPAFMPDSPMGGLERTSHDLEQRGFPASIRTDDSRGRPGFNLKTDFFERPEFAMTFPVTAREHLPQPIIRTFINAITFGNAFYAECLTHARKTITVMRHIVTSWETARQAVYSNCSDARLARTCSLHDTRSLPGLRH